MSRAPRQEADARADAGRVFAHAMMAHHEGAIDMARLHLLHGIRPELRSFALKVIAEQQAEIELLRHWLERRVVQRDTPISISPRDRVYTADQVSNTIRVVYYLMRGGSLRESRARRSPGEAPVAP